MNCRVLVCSSLLCVLTTFAAAQETAKEAANAGAQKLASVAWLAGRWQSAAGERVTCEEHWSAPAGKAMVGMFRLLSGERPGVYELLLLEEEADGVWLRLRHFRPNMVEMEKEPLKLKLASATADKLVFENPTGEQPKRITYALAGDELTAKVETTRGGKPATLTLKMKRAM